MTKLHPGTLRCTCGHSMTAHCFFELSPTQCIGFFKNPPDNRCRCSSFKPKKHLIIDGKTNNV